LHAEANVGIALEKHALFHIDVAVKNDGPNEIHVNELALLRNSDDSRKTMSLNGDETRLMHGSALDRRMEGMEDAPSTSSRPYFTRKNVEQAFYDVSRPDLRNAPATPPAETAWATLEFAGVPFSIGSVVTAPRSTNPLWVLPAISVTLTPSAGIITPAKDSFTISTQVERAVVGGAFDGHIHIELPDGWQSEPKESAFAIKREETAQMESFHVTPAPGSTAARLTAAAKVGPENPKPVYTGIGPISGLPVIKETFTESFRKVGYPGLPETYFFSPAISHVRAVDVHVAPNLRVAYLPGTGDEVQSLLENIGIHATTLSVDDIAAGKLTDFNVLVIGTRAYTAHADLIAANQHILDFANSGGTVVAQYQAHAFRPTEAPFPITLGGDGEKVVEELAKVELSASSTGVLDWPNKITPADFDGWIEERGHGFPASWDAHYDAPTETHDADQEPQRGGLLVARYGKGYYVYTAFALYRQLPEAVPGAYRVFANLLSLGHQPQAQ
jgi:hypothetical protein